MKSNPCDRYKQIAIAYKENGYLLPKRNLKIAEQQIKSIHDLLTDGEWHTAQEISELIDVSKRTTHNIMRQLIKPFDVASGQQGYCIPQKHTILIT
jgi:biotin operon repressor